MGALHRRRDPYLLERDLVAYRGRHPEQFPETEPKAMPCRGEQRLAAEVALAVFRFELVPGAIRERAAATLTAMTRG